LDWPAVSPDLLPIEHLWDEMERRLRRLPNPPVTLPEMAQALVNIQSLPEGAAHKLTFILERSVATSGERLVNIWNNIPQPFLNNLVSSMRRRCVACIDANGGHTRY
jgi:hypothetical protein